MLLSLSKIDPSRLHPELQGALRAVLRGMEASGHPMIITDGFRSATQQAELYASGRTMPGPVVTNADGVRRKSMHQTGRAADCVFLSKGRPSWAEEHPWSWYGFLAKSCNLRWGGEFKRLHDRPHVEMKG